MLSQVLTEDITRVEKYSAYSLELALLSVHSTASLSPRLWNWQTAYYGHGRLPLTIVMLLLQLLRLYQQPDGYVTLMLRRWLAYDNTNQNKKAAVKRN